MFVRWTRSPDDDYRRTLPVASRARASHRAGRFRADAAGPGGSVSGLLAPDRAGGGVGRAGPALAGSPGSPGPLGWTDRVPSGRLADNRGRKYAVRVRPR